MYGYIYKLTNLLNDKIYIGKHKYPYPKLDENYTASGVYINKSINKNGIDNFTKELIDVADSLEELNQKEKHYIELFDCMHPNGYNLTSGGDGLRDPPECVRRKMAYWSGKKQSMESRNKRSETLKKVIHNEEWVRRISNSLKGKPVSIKTTNASSIRHRDTVWYNNGVEEHMYKECDIPNGWIKGRLKNPFPNTKGINHREETKRKISSSKSGSSWYNNGETEIMIKDMNDIPQGFVKGRLKRK